MAAVAIWMRVVELVGPSDVYKAGLDDLRVYHQHCVAMNTRVICEHGRQPAICHRVSGRFHRVCMALHLRHWLLVFSD